MRRLLISACTDLVDKASQEQSGGQIEGESLLLPLLQGLLEAPENEQPADSGTESGEDQRSGLIAEVQSALDKLSASLRSDATDITPERRCSLLQLVTKLQAGLSTTNPKLERRQSSGPGRFNKRRQRQSRHTVGVSSEELADARRLMEEISLKDITPSQSQTKVTVLQKQNSEGSVTSNSSFNKFSHKIPVKNATAKPFSSSSNSNISNTSSSVQTPTDPAESFELIFNEDSGQYETPREKKSGYAVTKTSSKSSVDREPIKPSPLSQTTSTEEVSIKSVHKAVQQAAARKKGTSESAQESETEDDASTVTAPKETNETPPPSPLLENPIYSHPTETVDPNKTYEERCRRFNTPSKKLKMKRANTVDIPNTLNVYEDDEDDSETEDEIQQRKNNYYALRGPIRVGDPVKKNAMPLFEPKTESDQKFLAFINKNNQNTSGSGSLWSGSNSKTTVWGSKFGNIKNNFEKATSSVPNNPARSFWKSADDAVNSGSTPYGPKISRRSARNLQQMFEEKQRQSQEKVQNDNEGVVTGSLTLKTEPDRNYKLVSQPVAMNMFSHAPQSAFKPINKKIPQKPESLPITTDQDILKTEIKENKSDPPLFLYSPKPLHNSQASSTTSSPIVTSKPWVTNATDHGGRVLSMAVKKFEAPPPPQENHFVKPRRLSKEINKPFIPQPSPPEKLTAPYLVKTADQKSSTVRKLSGQYDNLGNKPLEYGSQSTVRHQQPQEKQHYTPNHTVPPYITQSHKPLQNTTPTYQANTCNQNNITAQKQQYTQPFVPKTPQNYQANTKAPTQFTPTQHYQTQNQTPSQQFTPTQNYQSQTQYNTQTYTQNKPQIQNYQPSNYSIRYDQQPQTRAFQIYNPIQDYQPVNYSIKYDKPVIDPQLTQARSKPPQQPETPSYTLQTSVQQSQVVPCQDVEPEKEYTSTCQFTPQPDKSQTKPQIQVQPVEPVSHPPKLETQISNDSVCEYTAISSKVMTGPVSQQAVTVRQKSPMSRMEHDMEAAFNLRNSLQKVGKPDMSNTSKSPSNSFRYKQSEPKTASPNNSFKYKSEPPARPVSTSNNRYGSSQPKPLSPVRYNTEAQNSSQNNYTKYNPNDVPKPTICPSSFKFSSSGQFPQRSVTNESKTFGVVKPMQHKPTTATPIYNNVTGKVRESLEINDKGQSVVTSKFNIPVINVKKSSAPNTPSAAQVLSKSDSWHQICMANQSGTSPAISSTGRPVMRSKSSHTLAVPQKQFEAGMSKDELVQKKKTMEAYFSGNKSPQPSDSTKIEAKVVKRSINRIKTSEKTSAYRQSSGLCRSRTLPDIICPEMLDESNPDKAFDDLFKFNS